MGGLNELIDRVMLVLGGRAVRGFVPAAGSSGLERTLLLGELEAFGLPVKRCQAVTDALMTIHRQEEGVSRQRLALFFRLQFASIVREEFDQLLSEPATEKSIQVDRSLLHLARQLFGSELEDAVFEMPTFPDIAPEAYIDRRDKDETPVSFIRRVYGAWLRADGFGLTRADIRKLDQKLYMALSNWLRHDALPPDCPLPTKTEAAERIISYALGDRYPHILGNADLLRRIASALQARANNLDDD